MSCILVTHKQSPSLNAPKIYIICEFICIINIFHFKWYCQHHCAAIETTHELDFFSFQVNSFIQGNAKTQNSKHAC